MSSEPEREPSAGRGAGEALRHCYGATLRSAHAVWTAIWKPMTLVGCVAVAMVVARDARGPVGPMAGLLEHAATMAVLLYVTLIWAGVAVVAVCVSASAERSSDLPHARFVERAFLAVAVLSSVTVAATMTAISLRIGPLLRALITAVA